LLFPQIPDLVAFRTRFRALINALELPPALVSELLGEAQQSFALTKALYESLA
jgi:heme oxygenase